MIVLDASLVGPLTIPDEAGDIDPAAAGALLDGAIVVPVHWRLEIANMLRSAVRRGRLSADQRDEALFRLAALPVTMDRAGWDFAWSATIELADRHDLTPYDAAYLEVARRRGATLATRDRALIKAAHAERISVTELR